jgi:hypothetical protein
MGCAVDPTSGDLAVANAEELSIRGSLAVYRRARGKARIYTGPLQGYVTCAYDNSGNLLATDGQENSSYMGSGFAWLARGSHKLATLRCTAARRFSGTTTMFTESSGTGNIA